MLNDNLVMEASVSQLHPSHQAIQGKTDEATQVCCYARCDQSIVDVHGLPTDGIANLWRLHCHVTP